MAIIASSINQASVQAKGEVMNATVNFSGALMEMLATVYVHILMAAIREGVQNACDAAKRAGLSYAEGVLVQLPTPENPMITITDKGAGMTREFMETTYMSFGTSTKAGDNGSAGGLGVGRWAAYGYIREAYIATCNAEDMIERTFFQFQGPDSTPQVQLASEVPGKVTGTRVFFPVKESDLDEALRAVAWLKEIMQLTMGDSFTVDMPEALPDMLPEFSGTVLELGEEDSGLAGIRVYPMKGHALQYNRNGLDSGSLVVLTNQAEQVGGLPFHVRSGMGMNSVFEQGMIVEIPMSYKIPFMPSREEIKYTDEVRALMTRIDEAAASLLVRTVKAWYDAPGLKPKARIASLLGGPKTGWHWFSYGVNNGVLVERLRKATGGSVWQNTMGILEVPEFRMPGLQLKVVVTGELAVLREAYLRGGALVTYAKDAVVPVMFLLDTPVIVIRNDLPTGGVQRFRAWYRGQAKGQLYLYISGAKPGEAQVAAEALNAAYGNELEVIPTSSLPEVARVVVGSKVVKSGARAGSLAYYDFDHGKQMAAPLEFDAYSSMEPLRVYVGKNGGQLSGFKSDVALADLMSRWGNGDLKSVHRALGLNKLYLLSPKQVQTLADAQADVREQGLWDLLPDEFGEDADGVAASNEVAALKSWVPLEDALERVVASQPIQDVLCGNAVHSVTENWDMKNFCRAMAKAPRMMLTGTRFDKAIAPHVDLLSGTVKLQSADSEAARSLNRLCAGLVMVGLKLELGSDATESRKELAATLARLAEVGSLDYNQVWAGIEKEFPLLTMLHRTHSLPDAAIDHLCHALAAVYK